MRRNSNDILYGRYDKIVADHLGGMTTEEVSNANFVSKSMASRIVRIYTRAVNNEIGKVESESGNPALVEWARQYIPKPKEIVVSAEPEPKDDGVVHEGDKVKHIFLGEGVVTSLEGRFIKVKFEGGEKMFLKNEIAKNGVLTKVVEPKEEPQKSVEQLLAEILTELKKLTKDK